MKQRIQSTFAYLGGSCIVTALTTAAAVQSSTMMTSMTRDARFGTIGIMIASDLMLRLVLVFMIDLKFLLHGS